MHQFCCVATVTNRTTQAGTTPPSSSSLLELLNMPATTPSFRSLSTSGRTRGSPSLPSSNRSWCIPSTSNNNDNNRLIQRSKSSTADLFNRQPSARDNQALMVDQREVKINDIVGCGISGVLHKWVNYGRGWRPRWFVLQDGVLSYYKIHGPKKITLSHEKERGSMVIGEDSFRRLSRKPRTQSRLRKPVGELHLKVCSIRVSKSDERRFSMYTGTKKRVHLRAESGEDRAAWVEALSAVKEMFPRVSNAELMADSMVVSTERLRQRLLEEGLNEVAIQECENIMRAELSQLHKHLVVLKQKQLLLIDALRHLETEKVDLENTLVDESQRQTTEQGISFTSRLDKFSEGSASDSYDDNDRHEGEEETDDDDNAFFDTQDFLSSSSFKSNGSNFQKSPLDSDDEEEGLDSENGVDSFIRSVGSNHPYVRRRKKLPEPVEKEKGVSLWSMIKDNIGKDLTKVCLPVYFNEPLSSLQKCCEDVEYSYLLDQAYEWGKMGNSLMRILNVAAFAVSGYASTDGRSCKPFNPLLGETYEADYPDKGLRFISEKVSHHPTIVACYCEGRGWRFSGDSDLKSKFWGRTIQLDPVGLLTLEFDDGEVFEWSKVTTSIYNLIIGKLYCDHYGTMRIEGNRDYSCKLKFKEQSIIDRNPHQVQGTVQDKDGKTVATLIGKWDEGMRYVIGDGSRKEKGSNSLLEPQFLWKRSKPSKYPTRYNLTRFAITLNELTHGLEEKLPPTDSRLRPDQRCLENGEYEMANSEKLRLEQKQRQARKMQESGWKPRWFAKDKFRNTYRYIGGYWEAREKHKWEGCPNIFGQLPTDLNFE
ncbi:oxysterol-binding protein-related protein 1C-like isoform X1 [Corylus avellana]|uniref:oxysterol-binding protein-related protein 1C-like isoform X1 n=1 Tax=Corylus avellana TaxID=13451 RepID=UPI00286B1321|nr:oxysterol-binding protein-related protein 1C-like isoform X1 [Corylus avellana]